MNGYAQFGALLHLIFCLSGKEVERDVAAPSNVRAVVTTSQCSRFINWALFGFQRLVKPSRSRDLAHQFEQEADSRAEVCPAEVTS